MTVAAQIGEIKVDAVIDTAGMLRRAGLQLLDAAEAIDPYTDADLPDGVHTFRKLPIEIAAAQLPGGHGDDREARFMEIYQWVERNTQGSFDPKAQEVPESGVSIEPETGFMLIATLEGVMQAKPGDIIIQGVNGEFYPCKPDIFAKTYEFVEPQ